MHRAFPILALVVLAAVAQYDIDLRLGNPYPWPLRLQARAQGDRLEVRVFGRERPRTAVVAVTQTRMP